MKVISALNGGLMNFIVDGKEIVALGRDKSVFTKEILNRDVYKVSDCSNNFRYIYLIGKRGI